jgi:hypothetical protein
VCPRREGRPWLRAQKTRLPASQQEHIMIRNTLLCTLAVCGVARAARADVPPPPDGAAPATAADGLDPPVPAVADPLAEPLATPSRNAAPPAPATITTRYARWTLTADGVALGLVGVGLLVDDTVGPGVTVAGVLACALAVPVLHVTRGHIGRGLGSAATRQALFWGGALLGGTLAGSDSSGDGDFAIDPDGLSGVVVGGVAGYAAAVVIDAVFLSSERAPALAPQVVVTGGRVQVGVAGLF